MHLEAGGDLASIDTDLSAFSFKCQLVSTGTT